MHIIIRKTTIAKWADDKDSTMKFLHFTKKPFSPSFKSCLNAALEYNIGQNDWMWFCKNMENHYENWIVKKFKWQETFRKYVKNSKKITDEYSLIEKDTTAFYAVCFWKTYRDFFHYSEGR